jgi:hypothetical protein
MRNETNVRITTDIDEVQTEGYEVSCQDKPEVLHYRTRELYECRSDVPTCHGRDSENRNRRWNIHSVRQNSAKLELRTITTESMSYNEAFAIGDVGRRIKFQSRTREHIRPMDAPFIYQTIVYFRKENKFKTVKTWPDQCMYAVLQAQKRTHAIKV